MRDGKLSRFFGSGLKVGPLVLTELEPMAGNKKNNLPKEIRNSKVLRDYIVEDRFEAGIILTGTEVKSLRAAKASVNEGFCRFVKSDLFIYGLHIDEYAWGSMNNHIPRRERKLLLHKHELRKLKKHMEAGGKNIIPTRLYFKEALVKVEIGLCVGKKLFDKREDLKKKAVMRDMDRSMKDLRDS
jgi:SsrA-binding protein|tara:strand:+ start:456 stop:1010 length:555 start_codon:yes stop_codon:yes gene_type:complete